MDLDMEKCIKFMKEKHNGQLRKQGTPYYTHPLQVSIILKEKGFNIEYQIIGLFHDLLEDTNTTYDEIVNITNAKIADTVVLLTKEEGYIMEEYIKRIKANEIAKNVKLADRVHNLSELKFTSEEFKQNYIRDTEKWFISLAKNTAFETDFNDILTKLKIRGENL